jgi:site-specific DNA recombinase
MDRVRELVETGGVSVVLAQDRDRFAREPAYHYLLRKEFEEYGTRIRSLNDRGDDSPEGKLTDGILDQLAKYERAKVAERTRRGLLRKAREGRIIKGPKPNYGFRFNDNGDQLLIYEPEMRIVEQVFRMAAEGLGPKPIQARLYKEGIPSPTGKKVWPHRILKRQLILNDLYRPHSYEEISTLVSPEVAARLDPSKTYGIWWYNRRNIQKKQTSELLDSNSNRRLYKTHTSTKIRSKEDWIAVPVPAYLPRELVDQARFMTSSRKGFERKHGAREWELKGILRCSCGQNMQTHTAKADKTRPYYYYRCRRVIDYGPQACSQKGIRVEKVEPLVWDLVFGVLKDLEKIRHGMDILIQREREGAYEDPARQAAACEKKLAEYAHLRRAYQDQQAVGAMTLDELRLRLEELDDARSGIEAEMTALWRSQKRAEELEKNRDAVIASLEASIPNALDALSGEERNRLYRMLRIEVTPSSEGFEATGVFGVLEPTPTSATPTTSSPCSGPGRTATSARRPASTATTKGLWAP